MDEKIVKALYRAAALTFEELGFMFPSPELDPLQKYAATDATAAVDFDGPCSGRLVVRLCGGVLPVLAANMMGELDSPPERLQHDALGEITNIICGNLLPSLAGAKQVFQLRSPRVLERDEARAVEAAAPSASVSIGLEEGRADILLYLTKSGE
jgi:CheY-specific phosphatase CheX